MTRSSFTSWLYHVCVISAIGGLSLVVHQVPYLLSSKPYSIGADGDSAFHLALQMKLRDPTLFPKDIELNEMYLSSRPASEFAIHRTVVWVADHVFGRDLFAANTVVSWGNHLLFLAGCYCLGVYVLRSRGGAALFAAASVGLSQAFNAWWGMAPGAVIPKYVGLTLVPWFLLGYLCWSQRPRRVIILFFLLGLAVNVYPLLPLYLALLLLAVTCSRSRPPWGSCLTMGMAFLAGALPSVLVSAIGAFRKAGMLDAQALAIYEALLVRYYGYALLNPRYAAASLVSPVGFLLVVGGEGLLLWRRQADLDGKERRFFLRLNVWMAALGLLATAASLGHRIRFVLAHSLLVGGCVIWFLLQAARSGLVAKWLKVDLRGVGRQLVLFAVWTMVLSLFGLVGGAIWRPLLMFLFHRASAFLYIPGYLGCAWLVTYWAKQRSVTGLMIGAGIGSLMLLNGMMNTALFYDVRGERVAQTAMPYYALADWAAQDTASDSLFMVPYGPGHDTFYAFRVYSARAVLLQWATGEIVLSNPQIASEFWQMSSGVAPLYEQASQTSDFLRVAHRYRADYIITDQATPCLPALPVAYRNEAYTVFVVPPE